MDVSFLQRFDGRMVVQNLKKYLLGKLWIRF